MLNPFKKKDDGFKLDETSLPSLNDSNNISPSLNSNNLDVEESFPEPSFTNSSVISNNTVLGSSFSSQPNSINENINNNLHNDLIKTKIDSLESKINLIEVKISNMDQKLETIYQLILNEVSEETRRKFKVDSMMKNIKND